MPGALRLEEVATESAFSLDAADMDDLGGSAAFMAIGAAGGASGAFGARRQVAAATSERADKSIALPSAPPSSAAAKDSSFEPTVRTALANTAYYSGEIALNDAGKAQVSFIMPDTLGEWAVHVYAIAPGAKCGQAETRIISTKPIRLRLQSPRFFVENDEVVCSAIVHNDGDVAYAGNVRIETDALLELTAGKQVHQVKIPALGQQRIDWRLKVVGSGTTTLRMLTAEKDDGDAMQQTFPVLRYGVQRQTTSQHVITGGKSLVISHTIPQERDPTRSKMRLHWSPSLAVACLDALPFLLDYPHGCTEQTLNRFVPAVLVQRSLQKSGINIEEALAHAKRLAHMQTTAVKDRDLSRYSRARLGLEVFDADSLAALVGEGVERLQNMQVSDGGWGWFSGYGERSYPHTTAVVVRGLLRAAENEAKIDKSSLARGVSWLESYRAKSVDRLLAAEVEERSDRARPIDAFVQLTLAMAEKQDEEQKSLMQRFLWRDRLKMGPYGLCLIALALHENDGDKDKLQQIDDNIRQFIVRHQETGTAHLRMGAAYYGWYGSELEALATYLCFLSRRHIHSDLAREIAAYLVQNRRHASYWESTRDTAYVIDALLEFAERSGELQPDGELTIALNGEQVHQAQFSGISLFTQAGDISLPADQLSGKKMVWNIQKTGTSPLYVSNTATHFEKQDQLRAAGSHVKVQRRLFRLLRDDTTQTEQSASGTALEVKSDVYRRELISSATQLVSGDLVEVELVVQANNDYEYMLVRDGKASGSEPLEPRSGYQRSGPWAYVEYHDEEVRFYLRKLGRGETTLRYRTRVEIPGTFNCLPAKVEAMYSPDLVGNSTGLRIQVRDRSQ